jgi:PAS domain S-box-containing protein
VTPAEPRPRLRGSASFEAIEQLGEELFAALGDVVIEISPDGVYQRVLGTEAKLALPTRGLVGKRVGDIVDGEPARRVREAIGRLFEGGGTQSFEYQLPTPSGLRHYEARIVLASNGNALLIVRDVDDRKQGEQRLRESEQRFRTMADSAPVLLWMSGIDGLCNFFNQTWLRFTGRSLERELGNGWAEGVHAVDFQHCMTIYFDAFVERRAFSMFYRLRRADGEYRWLLDQGAPRFAPDGTFMGYIGSCVDVTEERLAREALGKLNEDLEGHVRSRTAQLEVSNRELEAFSYSASHDLRAPLRAMSGYSQILLEDHAEDLDDDGRDMLVRMRDASLKMGKLIDDLLSISRITRLEMTREPVDLSSLARGILADIRLEEREAVREVEVIVADGLRAEGDPSLLRIVLDNLLRNAWKFTSRRAHARIELGSARQEDGRHAFFVRDNGAGFEMSYAHKLFGAFQRLHSAAEFPGTGIGLATVQRIVNRHGGKIWAESAVDRGATFFFSL